MGKDIDVVFWLKKEDEKLLNNIISGTELEEYSDYILTGHLKEPGYISKIGEKFVLGKKKIWSQEDIPKEEFEGIPFVRIPKNSNYMYFLKGLILTPYSDINVEYHLKGKTITDRTGIPRVELLGSDQEDFVERVFNTYNSPLVDKHEEKDYRFILYEIIK